MEKEYNYKCEKCDYKTKYKSSYDKHNKSILHLTGERKKRSDKKENKCDECKYIFSSQKALKEHKLNKHSKIEEKEQKYKYFCIKCNVGKNNEKQYEKHIISKKHIQMMNIDIV
jgi:uncharacterized C2H2 Zn-finger protein